LVYIFPAKATHTLPELSQPDLLLVLLSLALAGLVHGSLGLGFPMTATPLLALLTDVQSAVLITLFPTIAVNLLSIYHGGKWRDSIGRYWPLAAYATIGSIVGTNILILSDPSPFRLLLAAIIILYLNLERLSLIRMGWIKNNPDLSLMIFGLIGGILAGTVNVMVPILVILALELGLKSTAMVQVFNLCFLGGKISQTTVFSVSGAIDQALLNIAIPGIGVAVAAWFIGVAIRDRIATKTYRKILKQLLLVTACVLIIQYLLDF
jgi:uncharacterized membrane protein YfcA